MFKSTLIVALSTLLTLIWTTLSAQVIDSNITFKQAVKNSDAPNEIISQLTLVDVQYYSLDSLLHTGQILIDQALSDEVKLIFELIKEIRYPVEMVIPVKFDMPNGLTSMANLNNTYCFHYRKTVLLATKLSSHAIGRAIDFNPFKNPFIYSNGDVKPNGAIYDTSHKMSLTNKHPLVIKLKQMGWQWGGDWTTHKDYMHFEK